MMSILFDDFSAFCFLSGGRLCYNLVMEIVQLQPTHAAAAARLHIAGQPGTFLTHLGPEILTLFYQTLPQSPSSFGFAMIEGAFLSQRQPRYATAVEQNSISACLGFVAATTSIGQLFINLGTHHIFQFLPLLLKRYRQQPRLLLHSLQTLAYPLRAHGLGINQAADKPQQDLPPASAELLSIMVESQYRSNGIGHQLLEQLIATCCKRNLQALDVTVDATNQRARCFYARHGFVETATFTLYGRTMCRYRKALFLRL